MNGENLTTSESKEFNIKNIKELKSKLEDFKKQNPDFDVQKLKKDIVKKLDNKEEISNTEKKLLNLLDKAGSIDNAIIIIDTVIKQVESSFASNFIDKAIKTVNFLKDKKDKIKIKATELKKRVKNKAKKVKEKTTKLTSDFIEIFNSKEKVKKIKDEIQDISKKNLSKEEKEKIIQKKTNELKKVQTNVEKKARETEALKKDVEQDKTEIKNTEDEVQALDNETKTIEKTTEYTTKTLGEVINKLSITGNIATTNKAVKVIEELSQIQKDVKKVNINEIKKEAKDTKKEIETHKEIEESIQKEKEETYKVLNEAKDEIMKYNDMLSFGRKFNEYNNTYYIKNPKEIKNITDVKKIGEILGKIKDCSMTFDELVNIELKGNIDVLKLVYEKIYKPKGQKFGIQDTKDFDFSNIENEEEFLSMLQNHAIKKYLITEEYDRKEQKSINEYLENFKNTKLKDKIESIFKTINNTKIKNIEKIDAKIFDLNKNEIDNYLIIKGFDNQGNILENILEIFKGKNIKKLGNYPKLLNKILQSKTNIKQIVNTEHSFYYIFLPENKKNIYSEVYLRSVTNDYNINYKELSRIRFNNIKQVVSLFKIFKEKGVKPNILIKYPEIKSTLLNFINNNKNKESLSNIKDEEIKQIINNIQSIIGNNYKEIEEYKNKYKNSQLNNQLKNNKNSLKDKLYSKEGKNSKFLNFLQKENSDIQGPIVGLVEITLGIDKNTSQYDLYISQLANGEQMTPTNFSNKLKKINNFIQETYLENKKEEENTKLSKTDSIILEEASKSFIKNKEFINYNGIEKNFEKFLEIKRIEAKKNKIDFNSSDYINDFIKTFGLEGLSNQWKSNIISHLQSKEKVEKFNLLVKNTNKNPEEIFKAFKKGDKKEIEKIWKNIDVEYKKQIKINLVNYEKENGEIELPINLIELENIDNRPIIDKSYNITQFPSKITENNTIIVNGKSIDNISSEEYKKLKIKDGKVGNSEALKNLVDMKEKLEKLGLEFVWKNRKSILKIMNNDSDLKISGVNATDDNLIDKREFNVLLQFILKIYGDKNPSTVESANNARIININEIGTISNKKEFHSGLSNIGKKFIEIGYFNSTGNIDIFGEDKLRQYVRNGYKIKK